MSKTKTEEWDVSNIWGITDDKGKVVFTMIPNIVLMQMIIGVYSFMETRVLLFILRMTYGFHREETKYLSLENFSEATGILKPHLSKAIKHLLSRLIILRSSKNGNKYRYAINLMTWDIDMKYYRYAEADSELSKGEYLVSNKRYGVGNPLGDKNLVVVYNPKGYNNSKNPYINTDINKDIKKDKSIGDTSSNSIKINSKSESIDSLLSSFKKQILSGYSEELIHQYLKRLPREKRYKLKEAWIEVYDEPYGGRKEVYLPFYLRAEESFYSKYKNT